ncbi:MAG: signal recognition particle receptor subunit alpha [Vampirovibrionales bacterium]
MMIPAFFQKTSQWFKTLWDSNVDTAWHTGTTLSEAQWDAIEMALLQSDMGLEMTEALMTRLRALPPEQLQTPEALQQALRHVTQAEAQAHHLLEAEGKPLESPIPEILPDEPLVLCVLGVNGSGKTTSLAKIAHWYMTRFPELLPPSACVMGAGDTFRAAAVSQLETWGERMGITTIKPEKAHGGDPASVAYQTLTYAKAHQQRLILLDTAGRLQSHQGLMAELKKTLTVCKQQCPPHARLRFLLVLDAHTGQNAHSQIKAFHDATGETLHGLILTKTEGSAKGGMVFPLLCQYRIPIWWLGTGETPEAFVPFEFHTWAAHVYTQIVPTPTTHA